MSALWRWLPERWHQRWMDLSGRERAGLSVALGVLALALLWSIGVAPAWRQWQQGQGQTQALQTQWQGLQALQAQASALSAQNRVRPEDAVRLLQTSLTTLGPGASMAVNGDLATVQIKGASAAAVSQWLAQARVQAQALPVQARLGRSSAAGGTPGPTGTLSAAPNGGNLTTAAPVGALGGLSTPATPVTPVPTAGAAPSTGPVWWEGQLVLQLPAPTKP
jgi:general secretion pathway protein M